MKLRGLWLSIHKWTGILLAVLIIPISLTGSVRSGTIGWTRRSIRSASRSERRAGAFTIRDAAAAQAALAPASGMRSCAIPNMAGSILPSPSPPQPGGGRPIRTMSGSSACRRGRRAPSNGGSSRSCSPHGSLRCPARDGRSSLGRRLHVHPSGRDWLWWTVTGSVRRGFAGGGRSPCNPSRWVLANGAAPSLSFTGFGFPSQRIRMFEPAATKQNGPPPKASGHGGPGRWSGPLTTPRAAGGRPDHAPGPSSAPLAHRSAEGRHAYSGRRPPEVTVTGRLRSVNPRARREPKRGALHEAACTTATDGLVWRSYLIGGIIPALMAINGIVMCQEQGWRRALDTKPTPG